MFTGYYAIRDTCIWSVLRKLPITFAYSLWCHLLKFGQTVAINHVRLICITWCVTSERHIAQLYRPVAQLSEGLRQNWLLNTSVGEGTEESGVQANERQTLEAEIEKNWTIEIMKESESKGKWVNVEQLRQWSMKKNVRNKTKCLKKKKKD